MTRSQWSDQEIETLFKKLPKVNDNRNPEEIYQQISRKVIRKKPAVKWIPAFAAVAALIVFTVLSSSLLQFNHSEQSKADKSTTEKAASESAGAGKKEDQQSDITKQESNDQDQQLPDNEDTPIEEAAEAPMDKEGQTEMLTEKQTKQLQTAALKTTSVYPGDLAEHSVLTIGIPDQQLNYYIPVSYIVNKTDHQGKLESLKQKMADVMEENFGLSDFYPLNVELTAGKEQGAVNINFTGGNTSAFGDNEAFFINALSETFRYDDEISKLTFSTDGKPGAEFSHMGPTQEEKINKIPMRAILLHKLNPESSALFVPSYNSYETIEAAFEEMKKLNEGASVSASVDQAINVAEFKASGEKLAVTFAKDTMIEESESHLRSIEAILLLAREFGYKKVQFVNSNIQTLGNLDLSQEIMVPVAPNKTS
ncbi:hypothetical protein CVD28_18155 [Bacillus sp. M6-12]|uniref:hypothetical protein n=1 Tax=Bacillus sp. M6-12 TaxID=2054166 RepID=UPI000C7591E5|nr:hypothetical protein [Bacillus sp. M6-12]PLS16389.1 hypothetical protein CVD28_18155 [Bacillus sp. M6-12]